MTKQLKKTLLILITGLGLLCNGCAHYQQYQQAQRAYVIETHALTGFSKVVVKGNINLELSQSQLSSIQLAGQKQYVAATDIKILNNTLYLSNQSSSAIKIKLTTAHVLREIVAADHIYLLVNNVSSKALNIYAYNEASVTLNGEFDIANIQQNGSGKIEIKWLNSNNLKIANNASGPIYLAGTVDTLALTATNHARIDGRYLRAQNATILATDNSRVDVLAIKTLDVFADKNSNVLYYKRPQEFNKITQDSANALLIEELK